MYANTAAAQQVVNTLQSYGVHAEGEVVTESYHAGVSNEDWTLAEISKAGGRVSRVRLLQEMGRVDISYIHAEVPADCPTCSGKPSIFMGCSTCRSTGSFTKTVRVNLSSMPTGSHMLWRREVKGAFIAWAKEEGVYAKGLGLLDEGNWSVLH